MPTRCWPKMRLTAAKLQDHRRGRFQTGPREGRIDTALEPVPRVGVDLQRPAGMRRAHRIEERGLDEDVHRLLGAARLEPAHHPGDALRPGLVGDDRHPLFEHVLLLVEPDQPLAPSREMHAQPARHLVRVEDVQRSALIEGEEVGDVHQRGNGTQADRLEARLKKLEPGRLK